MNRTPLDPEDPDLRRVAIRIAYDGTDFVGWQRQKRGRSVQEELERIFSRIAGDRPVAVIAAGRTDSGVHAHGQVAHADIVSRYDDRDLLHAVRRMSPDDLAVGALATVPRDFHARFKAYRRSYRYTIIDDPDPFMARYAWQTNLRLDIEALNAAARLLPGRHDFTSLSKHNPDTPDPVCEVVRAEWKLRENGLEFHISADRFLYGMVRLVVGLQIDVARGKRQLHEIVPLIEARDRSLQSMSVPARGLSLMEVLYPAAIFPDQDAG
jgi:tRNA pseudouridine38-40 synthase